MAQLKFLMVLAMLAGLVAGSPARAGEGDVVAEGEVVAEGDVVAEGEVLAEGDEHVVAPCEVVCCKPAPPVMVTLCVKDPCTCCTYQVCVCVPAKCAEVEPCLVSSRRGLFGRTVLTYSWPCCNYCVDVVITKHGRVIVR